MPPTPQEPQNLDIRTFELLLVVHRQQSFTRAAEELGVSQSVVSYGIDKLRQVFDDPLFVREGGKTLPTKRCDRLVTFAGDMLSDFHALRLSGRFDPATTTERLVIACNYYERLLMVPRIAAAIKQQAPLMQIEIIDASGLGHEKLLNREADLLIGPFQRDDASFYTRTLSTDRYVCMMDPAHPDAGRTLSIRDYLALDHVLVTYGGRWKSNYVTALEALGHRLSPAIRIPSPAGIEELVAGTNLVATLPEGLARKLGQSLTLAPCPVPDPIKVQLVWTTAKHHSEMLRWVRNLIAQVVQAPSASVAEAPHIS